MPLSRPIKLSDLNTAVFVTPNTSLININGRKSRIYARSYVYDTLLRMSEYESGTTERHWGSSISRSWIRAGDNLNYGPNPLDAGRITIDLSTVNPLMDDGDIFSMVVGSTIGWTGTNYEVHELYYTYGTQLYNPRVNLNPFGGNGKQNYLQCEYEGTDIFSFYTYYQGNDTDSPRNTAYLLSMRWWGTGGLPAGTIVNRDTTVAEYIAANPQNV